MEKQVGRPIVILGMDRSGTSLVASLVARWGAYGGDPKLLQSGNEANPRGYYENAALGKFMEAHFESIELTFWKPSFVETLREKARDPVIREKAKETVAEIGRQSDVWFWKEPYMSLVHPFWNEILEEPTFIIPLRNPHDSARSWQKFIVPKEFWDQVNLTAANLLRWQHMLRSVMEGTNHARHRRFFISYEELVASPHEQCQRLSDFLDHHFGTTGRPTDRVEQMVQEVTPSLHRNKSPIPFDEVPEATKEQKELYQFLLSAIENPEVSFDPADFPMYAGWREYLENSYRLIKFYRINSLLYLPQRLLNRCGSLFRRT